MSETVDIHAVSGGAKQKPLRVVVISGGTSNPSSTRMLAEQMTSRLLRLASERGVVLRIKVIELRDLASELAPAFVAQHIGPRLSEAIDALAKADAVIAATPIYKAGLSGLFKSFIDVLDNDLLIAKPVALLATAGTARHALVVDAQMRSLFAFMRTITIPTSLFAASEDWGSHELGERVARAAHVLLTLTESGVGDAVRNGAWRSYQHQLGSAAERDDEDLIDFDSDLMKLAAGGN
jgi:FMN reductase